MSVRCSDGIPCFRCKKPLFGSTPAHWLHIGRNLCPSRVSVSADYSDSVSDSSNYRSNQGFHPLEEIKVSKRVRITKLTSAEIARTTVEVRCKIGLSYRNMKISVKMME